MNHDIRVVAFDLDDTLIRLDPTFVPEYVRLLDETLRAALALSEPLSGHFLEVTNQMMAKMRDEESLQDFFFRQFSERASLTRNQIEGPLTAFYEEIFPRLRSLARPVYGAMGMLSQLKAAGYQVALLTSALFPKAAIDERLRWAGLEGFPFDWRTAFEVVHATKPQPGYYEEAADALGVPPQAWLMVGNDLVEDIIPARSAGMAAYWVRDQKPTAEEEATLPPGTPWGPVEAVLSHLGLA
ncbi:HAD family hydrolase [Sulfobacillus harzensis]|uniref:HAD family hydrolase n=1 Tax=Sulfobacillus harzensis TaxID=2729629 RepID=A0A7Y0L2E9_9FIRM|nr:HAD family hydrolase [Sulfobacillus harzensis]NMP21970.1 HAD family hydrolase [Sulfobacillus harzensis]